MAQRVYFAGPLFNEAERDFNLALTTRIEALGFSVFLPQRDGIEPRAAPFTEMSGEDTARAIFELDRDEVIAADILLFLLDGRVPDEGACVELGMAYMHQRLAQPDKQLIGLMTDNRVAFSEFPLNPMLAAPLERVFKDAESLLAYLAEMRAS